MFHCVIPLREGLCSKSLLRMDHLTPLTDCKTIHPRFVVDNKNLGTFSPARQFINSVSTEQHVSTHQVGKNGRYIHSVLVFHCCQPDDGPVGQNTLLS
jgi:hypothetical protein